MSEVDSTPRVRLALRGEIDAATPRNGIELLLNVNPRPTLLGPTEESSTVDA